MSCPQLAPAPLRCPTFVESFEATAAITPKGDAWPVNDGGGTIHRYLQWLPGLVGPPAAADWPTGFVQAGWFASLASVRNYVETRLCALREEFWCATHVETHAEWMAEYGLPDPCDPFPDLCVKVAAIGGTRCEYYVEIAARAGWSIECSDEVAQCGAEAGCSEAGCDEAAGRTSMCRLIITVNLEESDAYVGGWQVLPYAGCFEAGFPLACDPNIDALKCIMERIVHAHVEVVYEIIEPSLYLMANDDHHLTDGDALLIAD